MNNSDKLMAAQTVKEALQLGKMLGTAKGHLGTGWKRYKQLLSGGRLAHTGARAERAQDLYGTGSVFGNAYDQARNMASSFAGRPAHPVAVSYFDRIKRENDILRNMRNIADLGHSTEVKKVLGTQLGTGATAGGGLAGIIAALRGNDEEQ